MNHADIGPANFLTNQRRQSRHLIAAGKDVTGIYAAAECISAIHTDQVLNKGTEHAQITSDFGTLTCAGFKKQTAARNAAITCGVQDRAEEAPHTTETLGFPHFEGFTDVNDYSSCAHTGALLEEVDDERNETLPAASIIARRIGPRAWIDDIGRMNEEANIKFCDRRTNRITRCRRPRTVGERFRRRGKYLRSGEGRKFTMEGMKKGGKAGTVTANTGAAVIANRRKRHCCLTPSNRETYFQFFHEPT